MVTFTINIPLYVSIYTIHGSYGDTVAQHYFKMVSGIQQYARYIHPSQSWRKLKVLHVPMTDPWCWYINANIKGVYWWDPWHTIYSSTMDPMGYKVMIFSSPRFEDVGEFVGHAFWCTVWDPKYLDGKGHTQPSLNPPKPAHACPICCWVE